MKDSDVVKGLKEIGVDAKRWFKNWNKRIDRLAKRIKLRCEYEID
jgi:hypothetical protein